MVDIFKLNDVIKTQEAIQKEPDILKRRPTPEFSFEEAIKHPKEFATSTEEEFVVCKGEDKLTLSQEGRTAYEITKIILGVLKTPDIREDKVHSAKELLQEGRLLSRRGIVDIVADRLIKKLLYSIAL
ncbi:MAG: flagellar biosynthesis anti-sigma factor FlgM [bacterium]|nr:flagellar biosynthesis anti-sigma factor FlgM [bacterium]